MGFVYAGQRINEIACFDDHLLLLEAEILVVRYLFVSECDCECECECVYKGTYGARGSVCILRN